MDLPTHLSLRDLIQGFLAVKHISLAYWEVVVSMDPSTLRGSYAPVPPGDVALNQLPPNKHEPLDPSIVDTVQFIIQENGQAISASKGGGAASAYVSEASTYLAVLTKSKQALLDYTVRNPEFLNTGICGETANKLAHIIGGQGLQSGDLATLLETLRLGDDLPAWYAVVSIGPSHRFLVERIGTRVVLLQSWVGRFSLARWVRDGRVEWTVNDMLQALPVALPTVRDDRINAPYNQLFNVKGVTPTPSPHIASEVTCDIYMTTDNDTVRKNLATSFEKDLEKWT